MGETDRARTLEPDPNAPDPETVVFLRGYVLGQIAAGYSGVLAARLHIPEFLLRDFAASKATLGLWPLNTLYKLASDIMAQLS